MSPQEILSDGRPYLDAVLILPGFTFVLGQADRGSGGPFVQAAYVRGRRRLEFSVRQSLGLVAYIDGDSSLSHDEYVRAVTAGQQKGAIQDSAMRPPMRLPTWLAIFSSAVALRAKGGPTAPPDGLYLTRVMYDDATRPNSSSPR